MAKAGQHNRDKSVFGNKLTEIRDTQNFESFAKFFGVSQATLSRYMSGAAAPSMQQLWDFVLRYAAEHDMQMIDLNWLMNDNDRRGGPVFVGASAESASKLIRDGGADKRGQPEISGQNTDMAVDLPGFNASRLNAPIMISQTQFHVVGQAAADESHGSRAGFFSDDAGRIWDDIRIPETTNYVKILGDSMSPVLLDGQYAMIGEECGPGNWPGDRDIVVAEVEVKDEEIGAGDREWEGVYCKRVVDGESAWHFHSISKSGDSFSVAKANCRLWPVIGVWFAGRGKPPEED